MPKGCLFRLGVLLFSLSPSFLFAQITSSHLSGFVFDSEQKGLPGAVIKVKHLPTGAIYGNVSREDGRYNFEVLKPGGPYEVRVEFPGYNSFVGNNLFLSLGKDKRLDIYLDAASSNVTLSDVVISGKPGGSGNGKSAGIQLSVGADEIEKLPSLNRSLQDFTRLSPQGNGNTFGGNNYRFNNLSIDGASNNDALGFRESTSGAGGSVASGTPGALSGTQPIGLDAIAEVVVSLAPFDITLGNFTGASLNAITRSGTNEFSGSVYGFGRNQWLTGKSVDEERKPIDAFYDTQAGFRLGGPIIKNKLLFFSNFEMGRRSEPVLNVPGTPGSNIPFEVAQAVIDTLSSRYGYDPGGFRKTNIGRRSDKLFLRLDFNLGLNHKLNLRHNLIIASADQLERGQNFLTFGSQGFTHKSVANSTVLEAKSAFGNRVSNHLILGYNNVEDNRTWSGDIFPHLEIGYNTANTLFLGTYREASIYGLSLGTFQFTDNLKVHLRKHTLTVGTTNEVYDIEYRFLTAWNGRWQYRSLEDFWNQLPFRVRGVYNYDNNSFEHNRNEPSADFRMALVSAYAQDQYKLTDNFSLTGGLRLDMQIQANPAEISSEVAKTTEFSGFNNQFGSSPQINPRLGFLLDLGKEKNQHLRGGSGLFSGRIPFAWYAYTHYISGVRYGNIDLRPDSTLPLITDPAQLQTLQPGLTEINLVHEDFKLPREWRSSIAYDLDFNEKWKFSVEAIFSKSISAIQFKSINLQDSTAQYQGADQREYYLGSSTDRKVNESFTNVFVLTNTNQGYSYNLAVSTEWKPLKFLDLGASYNYGVSKDISNGVRNSMAANFNWNQAVNSNDPDLSFSNFDLRHRIVGTSNLHQKIGSRQVSHLSLFFSARSGSPFSFTYAGDINRDGSSRNDLIYIPLNAQEIALTDILDQNGNVQVSKEEQWSLLDAYIESSSYLSKNRGEYAMRNGARTPWNLKVDLRLAHRIYMEGGYKGKHLELTLDIFNFANLIYHQWGLQHFVPNVTNSSYQLLEFEGEVNGTPIFQFNNPLGNPWQIDPLQSRWQAQFGLRYSF